MSNRLGIVVDGPGDFAAFRARFGSKFKIIKTGAPRGASVSAEMIAISTRKDVEILKAHRCSVVVVVTDFEERAEPYEKFLERLRARLLAADYGVPVRAVMPNRMIENWFLADIEHLSKKKAFLKDRLRQKKYEGTHGKREIKRLFKKTISYNEVMHGSQMFSTIRSDVAKLHSDSFRDLLDAIEG
jgi:hypothetical protein